MPSRLKACNFMNKNQLIFLTTHKFCMSVPRNTLQTYQISFNSRAHNGTTIAISGLIIKLCDNIVHLCKRPPIFFIHLYEKASNTGGIPKKWICHHCQHAVTFGQFTWWYCIPYNYIHNHLIIQSIASWLQTFFWRQLLDLMPWNIFW